MTSKQMNSESLNRATNSKSWANYEAIFNGFAVKGIEDIQPRINVFTFRAWKAKGRVVRKGEKGVKICTWIPVRKKDGTKDGVRPKTCTVFHVSQTKSLEK